MPAVALLLPAGCRDTYGRDAPFHWQQNMDFQQRIEAQESSDFFDNGRGNRKPVEGTVARASVEAPDDDRFRARDDAFYRGRTGESEPGLPHGRLIDRLPDDVELDAELLERGENRYNVFCAPCHAPAGTGDGIITQRGLDVKPTSYHTDRMRAMPLGYFFDVITNGYNTMKPYAAQIPVRDRWAIVAWIRTLQMSRSAGLDEVPQDVVDEHGWGQQ